MTKTTSKKLTSHPAEKRDPVEERVYMLRTVLVMAFIVVSFAIIGGLMYFRASAEPKVYRSDVLKFSITYPVNLVPSEAINRVDLKKGDDVVTIETQGTQFSSVDDYVEDFISKRTNISAKNIAHVPPFVELTEIQGKVRRVYFVVENFKTYTFSTNDPALFSDLDNIAKSFRILP